MCGITGCIGAENVQTVNRMLDTLPHRGPNDRGVHIFENGVFGHTRLSIVDVAHGHQPILANGGTAGIVCNGEIYNFEELNTEARRCITNVHNINLQRADRMGMLFSLELRVPFFDLAMVDLAMKISAGLKIRKHMGAGIEKWIIRRAFENTGYLPDEILWRYKVQYTQGAGCESLGAKLAEKQLRDADVERIRTQHPEAIIYSKEAAYYFQIFRQYHPQDPILNSIGIWTGFDFVEERQPIQGTVDGDLKYH